MACNNSDKTTTDVSLVRDLQEESQRGESIVLEANDAAELQLVQQRQRTSTSEDEVSFERCFPSESQPIRFENDSVTDTMILKSDSEVIQGQIYATTQSKELKYVLNINIANNNGNVVISRSPFVMSNIDAGKLDENGKDIFVKRSRFRFKQVEISSNELKNVQSINVANNDGVFILYLHCEHLGRQPHKDAKIVLGNRSEFCLEDVVNSSNECHEIVLNINVANNSGVFVVSSHCQFNFVDGQSEKNVKDGVHNRSEFCFRDGVNFSEERSQDVFNINVTNNNGNVNISQNATLNLVYGSQSVEDAPCNRSEFCLGDVVITNAIPSQL